jgi:hypothetical protein
VVGNTIDADGKALVAITEQIKAASQPSCAASGLRS